MDFDISINLREAYALNGFEDTSKAAFQDGLHFEIISFTDMHEWTLTEDV